MEEDKEILHILVSSNEAIFLEDKKEKLKGPNLGIIQPFHIKLPTNLVPNPIDPEKELPLTLYRLVIYLEFQNLWQYKPSIKW